MYCDFYKDFNKVKKTLRLADCFHAARRNVSCGLQLCNMRLVFGLNRKDVGKADATDNYPKQNALYKWADAD